MERFRTCDACARHVRAGETACPFCDQVLPIAALVQVPRTATQLSRAQRITLVATAAAGQLLAACGELTPPLESAPPASQVGGAGSGAAGSGGSAGAAMTSGLAPTPPYGAPPPPDAGASRGTGTGESDRGEPDDGGSPDPGDDGGNE